MSGTKADKQSSTESKVVPMRPASQVAVAKASSSNKKSVAPNVPGTTSVVKSSGSAAKKTRVKSRVSKSKPVVKAARKTASKKIDPVKKKSSTGATAVKAPKVKAAPKAANALTIFNPMEETMSKTNKQFDAYSKEAAEIGRETFDAAMKSSTIFAKGFEEIVRASVALAQSAAEKQAGYAKEAMTSKTINEWAELQSKYAQSSFDEFMAGATKISEMTVKTLSDASEPVNEQMTKAMNAAQKAAA